MFFGHSGQFHLYGQRTHPLIMGGPGEGGLGATYFKSAARPIWEESSL